MTFNSVLFHHIGQFLVKKLLIDENRNSFAICRESCLSKIVADEPVFLEVLVENSDDSLGNDVELLPQSPFFYHVLAWKIMLFIRAPEKISGLFKWDLIEE